MKIDIEMDWYFLIFQFSDKENCIPDSGGPLVFRKFPDELYYQVGIFSFGTCDTGTPGVYTKVHA